MSDWVDWYVDERLKISIKIESVLSNNTAEVICNHCGRTYSPQWNAYCPFCHRGQFDTSICN